MSNDLITIIYVNKNINLGVSPLFYNWSKEPLWQYMYNLFQPYSDSVIVIGLDTIESNDLFQDILHVAKNTKYSKILLVDISLCLLSENTVNNILNSQYENVCSVKKEKSTLLLDDKVHDKEILKFMGFDLIQSKYFKDNNFSSFETLYSFLNLKNTKLFNIPYEETFKLINKKDATILKHLFNL